MATHAWVFLPLLIISYILFSTAHLLLRAVHDGGGEQVRVLLHLGAESKTLKFHQVQCAKHDLTENPILKAYQDRTVFCLGETPSFRTPDGHSVRVVDYSVRRAFLFLVRQALGALDKLFYPTDPPLFCKLLY